MNENPQKAATVTTGTIFTLSLAIACACVFLFAFGVAGGPLVSRTMTGRVAEAAGGAIVCSLIVWIIFWLLLWRRFPLKNNLRRFGFLWLVGTVCLLIFK